jgi:hypothetical protein
VDVWMLEGHIALAEAGVVHGWFRSSRSSLAKEEETLGHSLDRNAIAATMVQEPQKA